MEIAKTDFTEMLRRMIKEKLIKGKLPCRDWPNIVLLLSASIHESEGFQNEVDPYPEKRPDETDDQYRKRKMYKGRGYIRLTGEKNFKAAYNDLEDQVENFLLSLYYQHFHRSFKACYNKHTKRIFY
eukprot:GHVP01035325.1.p1 GENE.GHVP01035325.1~~GHVP01035325.1.p1  ORF type:complete len:127 (+),score=15.65 GHVP01035325.1:610-990(+)